MIKNDYATLIKEQEQEPEVPDLFDHPYFKQPMSEETRTSLYLRYSRISNNDQSQRSLKWIGLRSLGFLEEECARACKPTEINREQVMRGVRELVREERRKLKKWKCSENVSLRSETNPDLEGLEWVVEERN